MVEGGTIQEEVTKRLVQRGDSALKGTQRAKKVCVIDMVQVHERQEVLNQRGILFLRLDESDLGPHQLHVAALTERSIAVQRRFQVFLLRQRKERLRQTTQIPEPDIGLLIEGITAAVVGMVTDEAGVVVVEKAEGAIVERETQDRHVVRIHDSMRPADGLPLRDQPRRALHQLGKETGILVCRRHEMRIVRRNHVIGQHSELFMLLSIIEDLERTEPHMRRRHTKHDRAGLDLFTIDLVVAAHDAQRPRRGNPQAMHRFAAEIFSDGGA